MSLIANILALFATFPIIPFIIVYFAVRFAQDDQKEASSWAINITTIFLITANATMINLFGHPEKGGGLLWIIFAFLIVAAGIAYLQLQKRKEIQWYRLIRSVWRLGFLSLTVLYVVLFVAHISVTIFS